VKDQEVDKRKLGERLKTVRHEN